MAVEQFGRYQLLRKLASGGMGQVYLARQQGPVGFEKLLVVKRILPHLAQEEEFIDMFFDEARIAAALNHPNIAQIYELGAVDGDYFIAMEYVHGESIRTVSERALAQLRGGMPLGLKCRVIADAAGGLDFAHRAKSPAGQELGLIHRDVSPHNILVGFNGSVKLIDFGVAKASGKISHTNTGSVKGKYAYMSPEQARGDELDRRADIFGLGIVFHELLTGQRLFRRDQEPATLKAVVQAKVPPPSSIVKGLPKELDAIVLKALAKKTADRYQTAADFQLAIEELISDQRLPATSAHLSAFMRSLFAAELSQERTASDLAAAPAAPDASTPSRSKPGAKSKTPSAKRRPSFDDLADERLTKAVTRLAPPAAIPEREPVAPPPLVEPPAPPPVTAAKRPEKPVPLVFDIGALEARLALPAATDRTSGMLFNAILKAVARYTGPVGEGPVREAGGGEREFVDPFAYPTPDFIRLLWKAGEVVAPMCEHADQAFVELGRACMDALLASPAGRTLARQERPIEPVWMLTSLIGAAQALASPGDRRFETTGSRSGAIHCSKDPLPPELWVGLVDQCFRKLRDEAPAGIDAIPSGVDRLELRVRW